MPRIIDAADASPQRQGFGIEARERTRLHTRRGLVCNLVDLLYFLYNKLWQGWDLMGNFVPQLRIPEVILKACAESLNTLLMTHPDRDAEYRLWVQQEVQDKCGRASSRLQSSLACAIIRRNDRLKSIRTHGFEQSNTSPDPEPLAEEEAAVPDALPAFVNWCGMGSESVGVRQDHASSSMSSSENNSMDFLDMVNLNDIRNFPSPPDKIESTGQPCVYCAKTLERSEFKGKNWIRHVFQDVRPFICLFNRCKEGDPFSSFESWATHMKLSHSERWARKLCPPIRWECWACGPQTTFKHEAGLRKHLGATHGRCITEHDDIWQRSKNMRRERLKMHICPLCHEWVTLTAEERYAIKPPHTICSALCDKLDKHIALGLCNLAFDTTLILQDGAARSDEEEEEEEEDERVDGEDKTLDEED